MARSAAAAAGTGIFRDVQGARYHALQEKRQQCFAGRVALGLDIDC